MFFNVTTPKFAAQAIKKAAEIGWKPVHLLNNVSNSVGSVLKPAGLEASKDVLSTGYLKDPTDPTWNDDAGKKEWLAFMEKYFPDGDMTELHGLRLHRGADAGTDAQAVRRRPHPRERDEAGREPEGPEAAAAAAGHRDQHQPDGLLSDRADADAKFTGERWELFGPVISGRRGEADVRRDVIDPPPHSPFPSRLAGEGGGGHASAAASGWRRFRYDLYGLIQRAAARMPRPIAAGTARRACRRPRARRPPPTRSTRRFGEGREARGGLAVAEIAPRRLLAEPELDAGGGSGGDQDPSAEMSAP